MERQQTLEEWARTADFPKPPLWGQVEAAVLARPLPAEPEPEVRGLGQGVLGKIGMIPVIVLGIALYGSPVAGLVLVLLAVGSDDATVAATCVGIAQIAFVVALAVPLTVLAAWGQTRRPGRWDLLLAGGTALAALVAVVVLLVNPPAAQSHVALWLAIGVAILGVGAVLGIMTASKPGRRYPSVRRQKLTPEQEQYRGMRAKTLEIIVQRGLVDEDNVDMVEMTTMPLGTWGDLDQRAQG